ncbi:hypothetical protein [Saccharothrix australiensis]|uniref:PPE family protein n=1 Tax=Saccharothrix australiensis TaxID=2072 RepID=A0A495VSD5_9PSEU|nr:hypothetical protein [Saccharothrix australiensis]RKT51607.1 hypothetical protein C8E97_0086 [Saccharothrix australiensis]
MTDFKQLKDHRFEGYDNGALAQLLDRFTSSDAAQRFSDASHALRSLAASLDTVDSTLREQLKKLGIDWQGAAGENSGKAVTVSADVATSGTEAGQQNSQTTAVQGATYSHSRNGMPESQKLRGDTETSFWDDAGGFFGYETDHAKEVKATQAAREQVIRGFDQYVEASRDSLGQYQGMTKPSSFDVTTTSGAVSTPVAHVQQFGGGVPTVGGGVPGSVPGGLPAGVAGSPLGGGVPGHLPGGPVGPAPQLPGGGTTGIGPGVPNPVTAPGVGPVLPAKAGPSNLGLGLGLGLAAGTSLGLAAGAARGGKVVRNTPTGPGGKPAGDAPRAAGGGGKAPGAPVKGVALPGAAPLSGKAGVSATIGAIDPDERVPARPGASGAAATGKAGAAGSMLHPAATAKNGEGEEDGEHIRKYGVDSDDVFGDERMVVQSVIGDEPERK